MKKLYVILIVATLLFTSIACKPAEDVVSFIVCTLVCEDNEACYDMCRFERSNK